MTTIEQENTARNKLPTAKGAALVLKLEDAVDRSEQLRQASGEALDGLRAELGDVPYLAEVLEAAVEVAREIAERQPQTQVMPGPGPPARRASTQATELARGAPSTSVWKSMS